MKILFCGPLGNSIGGGEAGNRKTISLLSDLGHSVYLHPKPYAKNGVILYLAAWLIYIFKLALFLTKKRYDFVHISGFYSHLVYFEFLIVAISRIFRVKVIYEIRAGGAIDYYKNGSWIYKKFFILVVKFSNNVLCQGKEYLAFLDREFQTKGIYYPNFVLSKYYSKFGYVRSCINVPRLIFVGRIVPEKKVDLILDILLELDTLGLQAEVNFIGNGNETYISEIRETAFKYGISDRVIFSGIKTGDALYEEMNFGHFFIFPSREPREGHSNALTEAMACGLVPIVSNQGFNKDIVGDEYLVVNKFTARSFAELIFNLWQSEKFDHYSKAARTRVGHLYIDTVVIETLRSIYTQDSD